MAKQTYFFSPQSTSYCLGFHREGISRSDYLCNDIFSLACFFLIASILKERAGRVCPGGVFSLQLANLLSVYGRS